MKVLFAAAEMAPLIRVGGLAEAAYGLVVALRRAKVDVGVVLPDYGDYPLTAEVRRPLSVPAWAGAVWARTGDHEVLGRVTFVGSDQIRRPNPYVDSTGVGWLDNDLRFMQFAAGIAALKRTTEPDVVHLNDWHTAPAVAMGPQLPTVLTIHTLGYQGVADGRWMDVLERDRDAFDWYGDINPLLGGIKVAHRVIAVSPNYAAEILRPESGMGLHGALAAKGEALIGIRNGIDTDEWNPATDGTIAATYHSDSLGDRAANRSHLEDLAGWAPSKDPIIGVVSRLVDQKGIDLLAAAVPYLDDMPARLFVLGSGLESIAAQLRAAAAAHPDRVYFFEGYDLELAHQIFAGSDLFAMPSRFEPCGLAQMQAMQYGSIPVVTPVGGLVDTVTDADQSKVGNGFVARTVDAVGFLDALHRGVRAARNARRRAAIQRRGMQSDWSWDEPAAQHMAIYESLAL